MGPSDIAADILGRLGPAAKGATPEIIAHCRALLERRDEASLKPLIQAQIRIGVDDECLQPFTDSLRHQDTERRILAIRCLRAFGSAGKPAIPALREALGDENRDVRFIAAEVLSELDPSVREAVAVLRSALADRRRQIRDGARYFLDTAFGESP